MRYQRTKVEIKDAVRNDSRTKSDFRGQLSSLEQKRKAHLSVMKTRNQKPAHAGESNGAQ